jgi:hypothetical protein
MAAFHHLIQTTFKPLGALPHRIASCINKTAIRGLSLIHHRAAKRLKCLPNLVRTGTPVYFVFGSNKPLITPFQGESTRRAKASGGLERSPGWWLDDEEEEEEEGLPHGERVASA